MKNKPEIEEYCKYCEKACVLTDPDIMLCEKKGVVSAKSKCRRFTYDPLKREPKLKSSLPQLEYVEI